MIVFSVIYNCFMAYFSMPPHYIFQYLIIDWGSAWSMFLYYVKTEYVSKILEDI